MDSDMGTLHRNEEERAALRQRETARRNGREFIRASYVGSIMPRVDGDGTICNIRMFAIEDVEIFAVPDYENPGRQKMDQKIVSTMVKLRQDLTNGEIYADILDTDYNRQFLSTHKDMLSPIDVKVKAEIELLVGKKYRVEPPEEDLVRREIKGLEKRLETLKINSGRSKKRAKAVELEAALNSNLDNIGDAKIPPEVNGDT